MQRVQRSPFRGFRARLRRRAARAPWLTVMVLAMVVASEYEFRERSQDAATTGSADLQVLVEVIVYGVAAAYLLFVVADPPRLERRDGLRLALGAFAAAMFLSVAYSPFLLLGAVRATQLVIVTGLAVVMAYGVRRDQVHALCHGYIVLAAVSVLIGLALPTQVVAGRFSFFYGHPNGSGLVLGIGALLALAYLVPPLAGTAVRRWPVWAYVTLLAVNTVATLATRSRGSIFATGIGFFALAYAGARRRNSRFDLLLLGGIVLVLLWAFFGSDIVTFWDRGDDPEEIRTLSSRTDLWADGWQLFLRRPLLGYGYTAARSVFLTTDNPLRDAHNAFFEVLVNTGLIGIVPWVLLVVAAVREAVRRCRRRFRHPDGPVVLGVLVFVIGSGLTDAGLGQAATVQSIWFGVAVGWLLAIRSWQGAPRPPAPGPDPAPVRVQLGTHAGNGNGSRPGQPVVALLRR